jgi:hypothetical protein
MTDARDRDAGLAHSCRIALRFDCSRTLTEASLAPVLSDLREKWARTRSYLRHTPQRRRRSLECRGTLRAPCVRREWADERRQIFRSATEEECVHEWRLSVDDHTSRYKALPDPIYFKRDPLPPDQSKLFMPLPSPRSSPSPISERSRLDCSIDRRRHTPFDGSRSDGSGRSGPAGDRIGARFDTAQGDQFHGWRPPLQPRCTHVHRARP